MACLVIQTRNLDIIVGICISANFSHSRGHLEFYLQFSPLHQIQCHHNGIRPSVSP